MSAHKPPATKLRHGSVADNPHYFTRRGGPWCQWQPHVAPAKPERSGR